MSPKQTQAMVTQLTMAQLQPPPNVRDFRSDEPCAAQAVKAG